MIFNFHSRSTFYLLIWYQNHVKPSQLTAEGFDYSSIHPSTHPPSIQSDIHRAFTASQPSRLVRMHWTRREGNSRKPEILWASPGTCESHLSEAVTDKKENGSRGQLISPAPPLFNNSDKNPWLDQGDAGREWVWLGQRQNVSLTH